jgi:hypothetical protein
MSMETGPTNTTELQPSWERDKTSQFVVIDLGKLQPTEQVNALRKGQGKLFSDLERILEDLVAAGTIQSNAQPVIVVVRENSAPAIEVPDDSDDD